MASRQLFVSYSRRDREVVSPMTAILRLTGAEVFRDEDSIPPGTKWQEAINNSITGCHCMVVFWSVNAAASDAVRYEYMHGATLKKDIAPILMDDTPMTPELSQFQAIDFRPASLKVEVENIRKANDDSLANKRFIRHSANSSRPTNIMSLSQMSSILSYYMRMPERGLSRRMLDLLADKIEITQLLNNKLEERIAMTP